jgi:hypothetical protein
VVIISLWIFVDDITAEKTGMMRSRRTLTTQERGAASAAPLFRFLKRGKMIVYSRLNAVVVARSVIVSERVERAASRIEAHRVACNIDVAEAGCATVHQL